MISVIGLWIAAGLLAIAILTIAVSGIRGMINGNIDAKKIVSIIVPIAIVVIAFLITGTWIKAGILTMLIMLALMALAIVATGVRGAFT